MPVELDSNLIVLLPRVRSDVRPAQAAVVP
jgi:hypothetical protein